MKRAFTTREKILLVILVLLIIGIGYFKLILEPINDSITEFQSKTAAEQDEMIQNTALVARMNSMRAELAEIYASGDARPLPTFSNSDQLLVELNQILLPCSEYTLNFASTSILEGNYIACRPLNLTFVAENYPLARSILDDLHDSDDINQISDLNLRFHDDGTVEATMLISFFELIVKE